jgi:hypothetical protein
MTMRTNITDSQVSHYTHKTQTTTGIGSQEYDDFEDDAEKEETREVFVSEEEQHVIQKIL